MRQVSKSMGIYFGNNNGDYFFRMPSSDIDLHFNTALELAAFILSFRGNLDAENRGLIDRYLIYELSNHLAAKTLEN